MNWTVADWLQLTYLCLTALGIIVTGFMAYWVVDTVQNKIDTDKTLRDHFAHEVIELRQEARLLITTITTANKLSAEEMKRNHFMLQSHINELLKILNSRYGVPKQYLRPYRSGISEILEKDSIYMASFKNSSPISLNDVTKRALYDVLRKNDHVFNEILLKLYETRN